LYVCHVCHAGRIHVKPEVAEWVLLWSGRGARRTEVIFRQGEDC